MPAKISTHVFKGMQKDINVANSSNEYLFDAKNIRFNQLDDNTLMSIVNEKGNECILQSGITGLYVSHYVIDNHIVVFTYLETTEDNTTTYTNCIYRIDINEPNAPTVSTLFDTSDLNIRPEKPLEFTSYFEAEGVIKIYWVDGVNQLRFMNIMVDEPYTDSNDFNTTPELQLNETVTVELIDGNGLFPAGVIQYALTYVNKLGAESNIFYVTKLHSITVNGKAGGPDKEINCAFKITISNIDTSFDYIRCYLLLRTSLDAQPTCLLLNEINIVDNQNVTIIDTNNGSIYDPTALLFQKYPIIPYTLDLKSNTLFLGNLNEEVFELSNSDILKIREYFNQEISNVPILRFGNSDLENYTCENDNDYIYNSNPDIIRTFKSREIYRIGVQLQNIYGVWSEPVYLKDIAVSCKQLQNDNIVTPISLIFDCLNAGYFPTLSKEYRRFRFLMVNPSSADRSTIAQGIVIPTMYELSDRCNNSPYSYNSWFLRPFNINNFAYKHNDLVRTLREYWAEVLSDRVAPDIPDNSEDPDADTRLKGYYTTEPIYKSAISDYDTADNGDPHPENGATVKIFIFSSRPYQGVGFLEMSCYITKQNLDLLTNTISLTELLTVPLAYDTGSLYWYFPEEGREGVGGYYGINDVVARIATKLTLSSLLATNILQNDNYPGHSSELPTYLNNYLLHDIKQWLMNVHLAIPPYNTPTPIVYGGLDGIFTSKPIDLSAFVVPNDGESVPYAAADLCEFRVDHSILNLYSPDIDNNWYTIDNNKLELNLIGYAETNTILDSAYIEIANTGASPNSHVSPNKIFNLHNYSRNIYFTRFLYTDTAVTKKKETTDGTEEVNYNKVKERTETDPLDGGDLEKLFDYAIYPWHNLGSLNNDDNTNGENRSATYAQKIFAKSWISKLTNYFDKVYKYKKSAIGNEIVSGCECGVSRVCNKTFDTIVFKQNNKSLTYKPNVDIMRSFVLKYNDETPYYVIYVKGPDGAFTILDTTNSGQLSLDFKILENSDWKLLNAGKDPIGFKYNSDTHVLIPIEFNLVTDYDGHNYDTKNNIAKLPKLYTDESNDLLRYYPLWDNQHRYGDNSRIITDKNGNTVLTNNAYLYIGEFYREVYNRYGGDIDVNAIIVEDNKKIYDRDDSVLVNNIYIPITESISIAELNKEITDPTKLLLVTTTYGDTWYGRWDCLKTLEMTDLDQLSIHDYASVMIESHINLNGRYDSYRNFYDLTLVNALNANKFNDVYNQMDTFWSYKVIPNYLKTTYYPNQVTWSLTKLTGALVDEWTKVTAANVQELDGNKGPINKILNYRDSLFVFQDRCISLIKYNEQTQMTTTEGVPVEISNSQKVTGIVKVYDGTGCVNKWSIASDANGIFFIDNVNECIIWLGGSLDTPIVNLSNSKAFTLFMKANNSFDVWNPKDFSNFVTFIDSAHKDVYFVNKDKCLCFSLVLQEFTSFYDYQRTFGMFNINNNFYSLYSPYTVNQLINVGSYGLLKLYRNFTGRYNYIYDGLKSTLFTFIDHGESFLIDKTFTNINYIQDAYCVQQYNPTSQLWNSVTDSYINDYDEVNYKYEKNITFDKLRVWTPFLNTGDITLNSITSDGSVSNVQRKFRTWGIQIPRDSILNPSGDLTNTVDRIRNNWAKFKFTFTLPDYNEDGTVKQGVTSPRDIKIELMNINILSIE